MRLVHLAGLTRCTSAAGRVGLGLAIVKGIAELHGGSASATSSPGAGTTVTLRFPAEAK
jgi:signal transduction histidine kinase